MTTFYDKIVAGIVSLFKYCMHSNIYEKQTDFQYIYDFQSAARATVFTRST